MENIYPGNAILVKFMSRQITTSAKKKTILKKYQEKPQTTFSFFLPLKSITKSNRLGSS